MPFAQKLKLLKKIALLGVLFFIAFTPLLYPNHAGAASYTWDGGGTDGTCGGNAGDGNKWSCALNWSSDIVPVAGDTVTFNAISTKDAVIDTSFQGTVTIININSGYTGTITQARSFTVTGAFSQSAGFYTASNQTLTISSTFTLNSGATFTASSGTTSVATSFTINSGATFNHNNGTVIFSPGTATLSCNNATFNLVSFTHTLNVVKTINSDCSLPMGNNPPSFAGSLIINGTLSGTGTLTNTGSAFTLASGGAITGFSALSTSAFTNNGGNMGSITSFTNTGGVTIAGAWNAGNYTTFTASFSFIMNSGANFTAPSGTMTVSSTFTINSGATFNHNNGTLNFNGSSVTLSCDNQIFNLVTFTHTTNNTKTVSSNCTFPLGNNPSTSTGSIVVNGTLSGSGTLSNGQLITLNSTGSLSGFTAFSANGFTHNGGSMGSITSYTSLATTTIAGTWNAGSFTTFNAAGYVVNSGGNFTAPSGTMTVSSTFTINSGATFNHNNGTLNFNGGSVTLSCNDTVFNLVTFTHTTNNHKTVSSNCTFPLGNNPSTGTGIITLNGTLSGTGTLSNGQLITLNSSGVLSGFTALSTSGFTHNGGNIGAITSITSAAITVGGTWNAGSFTTFNDTGTFVMNSGGNFTAPSGTMTVSSTFTINSGATFNHNNGTLIFNGPSVILTCNNQTFNLVTFAHTTNNTKTVSSDCSFPLGNNPSTSTGMITLNGTLSGTGTLSNGQLITLGSTGSLSGFFGLSTVSFTHNGGSLGTITNYTNTSTTTLSATWNASGYSTFSAGTTVLNSGANLTMPTTASSSTGGLTLNNGSTLTGGAGNITTGAFTMNTGSTFTASSGNTTFGGIFNIAGGTFNHNNGTVIFGQNGSSINCNNAVFNLVVISNILNTTTINSNCTLPLGHNPSVGTNASSLSVNGTLTGTGTLTQPANNVQFILGSTGVLSGFTAISVRDFTNNGGSMPSVTSFTSSAAVAVAGTWNASNYTTFNIPAAFTLNSGANFTAPSAGITYPTTFTINTGSTYNGGIGSNTFSGNFTMNGGTYNATSGVSNYNSTFTISGGTFNHNNGTINFGGTTSATLTCNSATFNNVTFTHTTGIKTIASNCTFPVGSNPNLSSGGNITNNGAITGSGILTVNGAFTMNSGSSINCFTGINANPFVYNGGNLGGCITSATLTWDGEGTDGTCGGNAGDGNKWSCALNWTGNVVPTQIDQVVFDGTSTKNSTIDSDFAGSILTLNINSGYIGTITQARSLTVNGAYTQSDGVFTQGSNTLTVQGNTTLSSGILNATGASTFAGTTFSFNSGTINTGSSTTTISSAFTGGNGSTFNAGSGTIDFSGAFVQNSGSTFNGGSATINYISTFVLNTGAVFTSTSGTLSAASTFTINTGVTFNHNNGTVNFSGAAASTVTCNSAVFNQARISHTAGVKTISANCTLPLGNNPTSFFSVTLSGTLSGSGTLIHTGVLTLSSTGVLSGFTTYSGTQFSTSSSNIGPITSFTVNVLTIATTFNASAFTTLDVNNNFVLNSGANFTAPSGTMTVASTFTINSGATFNHGNGTLSFDSAIAATQVLTCSGTYSFNIVRFDHTGGAKQISSNCTIPLGSNPTSAGPIILNGTFTGSGTLTVNGSFTMNTGSTLNCFTSISAQPFSYNGGSLGGCITSTTRTWDGGGSDGTCGGTGGDGNKWSCALNWSGDTVPGTFDAVVFDGTSTKNSTIDTDFGGNILTMTVSSAHTGTITQSRSLSVLGAYDQSNGIFNGSADSLNINGNYTLNSGSTFNSSSGNVTISGTYTQNSGSTMTAPSTILSIASTFTINSGATFNHNNGTVNFNSIFTSTLSCANASFNLVTFDFSGVGAVGTKTVSSNCSLPIGNNPVVESSITLDGTLSGSGIFYTAYTLTLNSTSQFNGFQAIDEIAGFASSTVGSSITLGANKVFNASNLDYIRLGNNFITTSGTFTAPPNMYVGRAFQINPNTTFNHNNGIITLTEPTVPTTATLIMACNANHNFNKIVFTHTTSPKQIRGFLAGTCTFPLGDNPTITGPIEVGSATSTFLGALQGTGTLTVNAALDHKATGTISDFDNVIFNSTYTYSTPTFTNVDKVTFNQPQTFATTFNGSQVGEIEFGDDVSFTGGTFTAPASIKVAGDWTKDLNTTFTHNSGTVEFIGTNDKTISGDTTFNNLKYAPAVDPTLSFEAGSTQTVLGELTLKGQAGEPVFLKSTSAGQQWNIDAQGTNDIEFVNVSDSNSTGSTISVGCDSVDGGNNTNWTFGSGCNPAVLNLGPSTLVNGSTISNNQPTFTFSIVDGDSWDQVKYTIEIDNNSDFSSPEVCYTSDFENTGNFSFTVGQSAGSGAYTCGEAGQRLANGSYYWRVSAVDLVGYSSGYEVANDGDIAFKVSVSLPVQIIEEIIDLIPDFDDEDEKGNTNDPTLPDTGEEPKPSEDDNSGSVKGSILVYIAAAVCSIPLAVVFIVMFIPILKKKRKKENAGS